MIDKKTEETYGRQWVSNWCSDITKTASSVENSIAGSVGDNSAAADAGSGAGAGSTNTSDPTIPQPSSTVTTANPMSSSTTSQESFATSKGSRMLNHHNVASKVTSYHTTVPVAFNA